MKRLFSNSLIFCLVGFGFVLVPHISSAESVKSDSRYTAVLEGKLTFVKARSLEIDGQQYPVSMFARVFHGDEKGPETTMQILANTGKVDKARIYVVRGKVEKIIVLKNI